MSSKKSVEKSVEKPTGAIDYDRLADAVVSRLAPLLFIAARVGELNTRQTLEGYDRQARRAIDEGLNAYRIVTREVS